MSEKNKIDILFIKFIENDLSKKEYKIFMDFFNDPDYRFYIESLMKKHWEEIPHSAKGLKEDEGNRDFQKRFQKITARIEKSDAGNLLPKKKVIKESNGSTPQLKIAAVILVLLGSFLYIKDTTVTNVLTLSPAKKANPEAVTLTLDNGNVKVIFTEDEQNITDARGNIIGTQNGRQLNYTRTIHSKKLAYNELAVPYGNQFELALSDGTQIKLNAGSSIKYPINFIKGQPRKVFLKGEAYFDVAEDLENPFIVNVNDIAVQVLGTEFNVSFYPEDPDITSVLVEGSVKFYENGQEGNTENAIFLKPGEKASWQKLDKKMSVEEVDVELYTAWREGVLLFRKTPFNNIRKKLERHFDLTIQNDYAFLDTQVYTASFKGESIYEILDAFNQDTPFLYDYNVETNKITLTQTQ